MILSNLLRKGKQKMSIQKRERIPILGRGNSYTTVAPKPLLSLLRFLQYGKYQVHGYAAAHKPRTSRPESRKESDSEAHLTDVPSDEEVGFALEVE